MSRLQDPHRLGLSYSTACGLHCPLAAAVAIMSRINLVPSPHNPPDAPKTSERLSLLSSPRSHPGFDAQSVYLSACQHRTLTSIWSCYRTPGKRGVVAKLRFHPVVQPKVRPFRVRRLPGTSVCSACASRRGAVWPSLHRTCRRKRWYGFFASDCSHISPLLPFRKEHAARGPAPDGMPSLNAVASLLWASCVSSVGDLCRAVQVVHPR